jgi:hypothetical protein
MSTGHPVQEERRDEPLPINPGGPMVPASYDSVTIIPASTVSGGEIVPASYEPATVAPGSTTTGGEIVAASPTATPMEFNPGGPMVPEQSNPGAPIVPAAQEVVARQEEDPFPTEATRPERYPTRPGRPGPTGPGRPGPTRPGRPDPNIGADLLEDSMVLAARTESFPTEATRPTRTPTRPGRPGPTRAGRPDPDIEACTSTMEITYSRLPTPPYWPECAWDGTQRLYTTTQTVYHSVDCKGCSEVEVHRNPKVHCPAKIINATMDVATPTTEYKTICSMTTAYSQMMQPVVAPRDFAGEKRNLAACPTTMLVTPMQDGGATSTIYQRTVVSTSRVQCGGCPLVISTKIGGPGVVFRPTATLTSTASTSLVYQCS